MAKKADFVSLGGCPAENISDSSISHFKKWCENMNIVSFALKQLIAILEQVNLFSLSFIGMGGDTGPTATFFKIPED